MKRRKAWEHALGERGHRVVVYERLAAGPLYMRFYDPTLPGRRMRRLSLGHRDKQQAKIFAAQQHARLVQEEVDLLAGRTRLSRLFALYLEHRTPRKCVSEQQEDARCAELWTRRLGADKDPHKVTLGEWERFCELRGSGTIDSRGRATEPESRRPVRTRTVAADLEWLGIVLNWGTKWRDREGRYLLRENPVRGYEVPREKNPRRPVATADRFKTLRAVTDQLPMQLRRGRRRHERSYLSELLDIVNGTGRRVSAVCALRYEDLRLNEGGPFGSICWPADTDKTGRETTVPIGPGVRAALERVLRERPGIGRAPLFPAPGDPHRPITRHLADKWLRRAERPAGIPSLPGGLWHPYRRKWATERKRLPDVDVAAGGWTETRTLKRVYQQADQETMVAVVLGADELREVRR